MTLLGTSHTVELLNYRCKFDLEGMMNDLSLEIVGANMFTAEEDREWLAYSYWQLGLDEPSACSLFYSELDLEVEDDRIKCDGGDGEDNDNSASGIFQPWVVITSMLVAIWSIVLAH